MGKPTEPLLFLDLETTGLDPDRDQILELAFILAHSDGLRPVTQGEYLVKPLRPITMDLVVAEMHSTNGLLAKLRYGNPVDVVEQEVIQMLHQGFDNIPAGDMPQLVLAGSSVHFDKSFLRVQMPELHKLLHYRIFDLSTIKTAYKCWVTSPDLPKLEEPNSKAHRAMTDVKADLAFATKFMQFFDNTDIRRRADIIFGPKAVEVSA